MAGAGVVENGVDHRLFRSPRTKPWQAETLRMFDAVSLRRAVYTNSLTGLCVTKLDVLDELEEIKICVGYRLGSEMLETPPLLADHYAQCEPIYETMPGWQSSTCGVTDFAALPQAARAYLERIEEILETPVDLVSTGPAREAVIVRRHPFDS